MTDNENTLETTVPANRWEEVIQFYTLILGSPRKGSEGDIIFSIPESEIELRVIRGEEEDKLIAFKKPHYHKAKNPKDVDDTYRSLLKSYKTAFSIAEPHKIGVPGRPPLTLAFVGFGDPCLFAHASFMLEGEIVCIIHNPNW